MKNLVSSFLIFCALSLSASPLHAQFSFGVASAFAPQERFAEIAIPATQLRTIIDDNLKDIDDRDICLDVKPQGSLKGFQADYDGDGNEEMWLLYHSGEADAGCNVMIVITPMGNGKYKLFDIMSLPKGKTSMHPILTLDDGVQMYLENKYTLPDGTAETQGTVLGYAQSTMIILTSWTNKDYMENGSMVYQDITALFYDMNFDKVKEFYVKFSKYDSPAKSKNALVEEYILVLDWLPENLRYELYDSLGYDKLQEAEELSAAGRRMMNRESTQMEGIAKVRKSLEINPFMTFTRVNLGKHFLHDGKYGDAERTLSMAVQIDPASETGFMLLGDTYLRLNDLQKAKWAYEKYMEFNPSGFNKRRVEKNLDRITKPR